MPPQPEETETTLARNPRQKAVADATAAGKPAQSHDSRHEVEAQGGRVGVQLNSRAKAAIRRCAITGQSEAGIVAQEDVELALWDNEIASVAGAGLQIARPLVIGRQSPMTTAPRSTAVSPGARLGE
jgi:hypothetical protein